MNTSKGATRTPPDQTRASHGCHPWYYIRGRKDLTEKNISGRREREAQRLRQSVDNNKYFMRCDNESKLFHNWNDNKTLVKSFNELHSTKPPFDTIEAKVDSNSVRRNKEVNNKYIESNKKLSQMMVEFNKLNDTCNRLQSSENIFISQFNELQKTKTFVNEKKEFFDLKEKRLFYIRFGRQKLRQKVFQICDQLICYKTAVQSLKDLNIGKGVLSPEELNQICEVNDKAIKILDMYIELNQNRNTQFQLIFDEEGEHLWLTQQMQWQQEYQVWNTLVQKLIDSFQTILTDKIRQFLSDQQMALKHREQLLTQLIAFADQLKLDPQLSFILNEDIKAFITNNN